LLLLTLLSKGQEPETIRFKKESNMIKAYFDPTELKLIGIDRFGNPHENGIASFKMYVKGKKDKKAFESFSGALTSEMINYLNNLKTATKLFFTDVVAKDENRHLTKLPDVIELWFPNCASTQKQKR
jgi:hypothetical protein